VAFSSCAFWERVGDRAFGGWANVDAETMLVADARFARHRSMPQLMSHLLSKEKADALREYRRVLGVFYSAIKEVSGCAVVVDSTKRASYALLLRDVPGVDLRLVHLVRDSRGVAFSCQKSFVERPEFVNDPDMKHMPTRSLLRSVLDWDVKNPLFNWIVPSARRRLVRYESLMSEPARELDRILRLADDDRFASCATQQTVTEFESLPFHTISGNPVRFKRGRIRLHADDEWKTEMRLSHKVVVSAFTLPLLMAYGYVGVPLRPWCSPWKVTCRRRRNAKVTRVPGKRSSTS
jgi:hypothetical protein